MTKISQLVDIGANLAANDEFIIRDVSEAGTPNKKVTSSGFIDYIVAQGTGAGFTQIAAGVGPLARALASSSGATGTLTFSTATATTLIERARIDSSGRLLVGTSSARAQFLVTPQFGVEGTNSNTSSIGLINNQNLNTAPYLFFGKTRGTAVGGVAAVQLGDILGGIYFQGANGTDLSNCGASIESYVDAEPFTSGDTTDLPGRLVFSTTADGAAVPVERMRIDSAGRVLVGTATANTSGAKLQTSDGLTFPATAVASADPNTLDDYEEGTWTPTVTNMTTTGTPAYGGRYRKIGSQVTIWFFTTTAGGVATYTATLNSTSVAGLPFASGYDGVNASGGPPGAVVNGSTSAGGFIQGPASGAVTFFFDTTIASTQGLSASLTYYV